MFSFIRRLFPASPAPRKALLGLDAFEDRVVPASINFANGVLLVDADQTTSDYIRVTPAGASSDGSTGVKVVTNVRGSWESLTFGDAATPVTLVALDMRDGNDFVDVASLRSTVVLVGEGNGNNFVRLGDTLAGGVVAGAGQNFISVGNSTQGEFGSLNLPGSANAAAFVGWGYVFGPGGQGIFLTGTTGNEANNVVHMGSDTGFRTFVDIVGNGSNLILTEAGDDGVSVIGSGNNLVYTGSGNDLVRIFGDGDNWVFTGSGDDTVELFGNGDNFVYSGSGHDAVAVSGGGNNTAGTSGSGSVTINGGGANTAFALCGSTATLSLNGAGAGSKVCATSTATVFVDGTQVTEPGLFGNVDVFFHE